MAAVLIMISSLCSFTSAAPMANYWLSSMGPLASSNDYHSQDGSGSYRYGYTGPHHAKMETRANGVTQGGYSYIDANGILQTVVYSADAQNGFRVRASNLPQQPENLQTLGQIPEEGAEQRRHLEGREKITDDKLTKIVSSRLSQNNFFDHYINMHISKRNASEQEPLGEKIYRNAIKNPFLLTIAEASEVGVPTPDSNLLKMAVHQRDGHLPNEQNIYSDHQDLDRPTNVVPLPNVHRTLVTPSTSSYVLPVVPYRLLHSSLHHTQDSLGQYDYSYVGDTSSKTESRSLDGTTRGAYSYVDANGLLQQVHYIADHNGFRVLATNLPEA